jgi:hypothetical protein
MATIESWEIGEFRARHSDGAWVRLRPSMEEWNP